MKNYILRAKQNNKEKGEKQMKKRKSRLSKKCVIICFVLAVIINCIRNYNWGTDETKHVTISESTEIAINTNNNNDTEVTTTESNQDSDSVLSSEAEATPDTESTFSIPEDGGESYCVVNNNVPLFSEEDKQRTDAFEIYSDLDNLGRCGVAYANICPELMPTEERGYIGQVKPSGWHTVKYDNVDGKYLYNRCHLIAYCLAGENANEKNLITGTRSFNVDGMLPFEEEVAKYVDRTGNHVLYRCTPYYRLNNLVASGVTIEAYSVEDHGEGIQFYVYIYNKQNGIHIDYATGNSWKED